MNTTNILKEKELFQLLKRWELLITLSAALRSLREISLFLNLSLICVYLWFKKNDYKKDLIVQ